MRTRLTLAVLALAGALAACGPKAQPAADAGTAVAPASGAPAQASLDPCAGKIKALCVDSDLAPLSAKMKDALFEAAADVSEEGAKVLASNQEDWLEAQRVACGVSTAGAALNAKQEACLKAALSQRLKDAAAVVEKRGPFTFQRVEINQSEPLAQTAATDALGAAAPDVITREIKYPRIDGDSPAIRKFNDAVKQSPRFKLTDQTEEQVTYKIAYAGADLVSVRFDLYDLTVGAANSNQSTRAVTINMLTGAPLAANDVFKPNARWADFLTTRALKDVTAQLRADDETAQAPSPDFLRKAAMNPDHWLITDKALVVLFSPTDLGSATAGTHEVAIPWRDLKAYLNPAGPGPIKSA